MPILGRKKNFRKFKRDEKAKQADVPQENETPVVEEKGVSVQN
jgi:hypothetical protein